MNKILLSVLVVVLFLGISNAQPDYSSQFDYKLNLSAALSQSGGAYPPVAWYYMLYYSVRGNSITFGVVCGVNTSSDWCSIGFSQYGDMVGGSGSDATVGTYNSTLGIQVYDLILADNIEPSTGAGNGVSGCSGAVCSDLIYANTPSCTNDVSNIAGNYTPAAGQTPPGYLYFTFTRPLAATNPACDLPVYVDPVPTSIIFAIGTVYSGLPFPVNLQKHYYVLNINLEPYNVTFLQMPSPSPSPSVGSSPSRTPSPTASPSTQPSSTPTSSPVAASPSPVPSASSSPDATSDSIRLSPWFSEVLELIF